MAVKFELIKPGDVLYQVRRVGMGNTVLSRTACYVVKVISIEEHGGTVSWNHNRPEFWSRRRLSRLRRSPVKERSPLS